MLHNFKKWFLYNVLVKILPKSFLWQMLKYAKNLGERRDPRIPSVTLEKIKMVKSKDDLQMLFCGVAPNKSLAYRYIFGENMGHTWSEMLSLEMLLNCTPCARIIELGTANGHFSSFLAMYAYLNKLDFITFDNNLQWINPRVIKMLERFKFNLSLADIFHPATVHKIAKKIKISGRTLLICDNGNKIKEFQIYAPFLKKGDLIIVDDWGDEIKYDDIKNIVKTEELQFFLPELFKNFHTHHMCFIKE